MGAQARIVTIGPQPGPQASLLSCPANEILYGGARAGGKSYGILLDWLAHEARYGHYARGILFRRTIPELEDMLEKARAILPGFGWRYAEQRRTWQAPSGATLKMRYLERDAHADRYQGHQYSWMGLDELGSWPRPDPINKLRATLRSVHVGDRVRMVASANPGGVGHNWIRKRYINPVPPYRLQHVDTELSHWTICYIPARFEDNRILYREDPGYLERATAGLPEWLARAWADGNWDIVAGGALDDLWGPHLILPRFKVPKTWRVDRSFDWGSTAPFSVCWWAEANGEEATLPDGRKFCPPKGTLIQIAEWYGATAIGENKGLKLSAKAVAQGIKEREEILRRDGWVNAPIRPGPADNQIRNVNETDSDSIEKKMADEGVYWTESDKRPGSRKVGLQLIRDRLEASQTREGPALYFMDNCRASIAILPTLPRDEKDPDDIDTNADDHIADAVKYRCLAGSNRYATQIDVRFAL